MSGCVRGGVWVLGFVALLVLAAEGCAPVQHVPPEYKNLPPPTSLVAPSPIPNNSGKYLCPYTQDEVLADWVDKAINAKLGAAIGNLLGAIAAAGEYEDDEEYEEDDATRSERIAQGARDGEQLGRDLAIALSGGWTYIRNTSDLSFNSFDAMAVYLYVKHSSHDHYYAALDATFQIYPELRLRYVDAIMRAPRR